MDGAARGHITEIWECSQAIFRFALRQWSDKKIADHLEVCRCWRIVSQP